MRKEREAREQRDDTKRVCEENLENHSLKPSAQIKRAIGKLREEEKSCQSQQVYFRRDGSLKMIYKNFRAEKRGKKSTEANKKRRREPDDGVVLKEGRGGGDQDSRPEGERRYEKYDLREILNEIDPTLNEDLVEALQQVRA